jgi:hypothetical protein
VGADLDVPATVVEVSPGDDRARGELDAAYGRWVAALAG